MTPSAAISSGVNIECVFHSAVKMPLINPISTAGHIPSIPAAKINGMALKTITVGARFSRGAVDSAEFFKIGRSNPIKTELMIENDANNSRILRNCCV